MAQPPYVRSPANEQKLLIMGYQANATMMSEISRLYNRSDYYFVANMSTTEALRNCSALYNLELSGISVLMSIPTAYGKRNLNDVLGDISFWRNTTQNKSCPVDGFFIDEVSSDVQYLSYYGSIAIRVRELPLPANKTILPIFLDVGRNASERHMSVADTLILFDGPLLEFGWSWAAPSWTATYPWSSFAVIVHGVPNATAMTSVMEITRKNRIQYVYVTNDAAPYPYDTLPPYMRQEMNAASRNLTWVRRGMYVSLNTNKIGTKIFSTNASWDKFDMIVQNATDTSELIRLIQQGQINTLTIYNLWGILRNATLTGLFQQFVLQARSNGIDYLEGIADNTEQAWRDMVSYSVNAPNAEMRFDGFVTEIEFWNNAGTVQDIVNISSLLRTLAPPTRTVGRPHSLQVYIGRVTASDVATLASANITGLLIHAYVTNPNNAFGYIVDRALLAMANNLYITPIFSAEGTTVAAGSEYFMGDWMMLQPGTPSEVLGRAEKTLFDSYMVSYPYAQGYYTGAQWYEYFFVSVHLRSAMAPSTTRPPNATSQPNGTLPNTTFPPPNVTSQPNGTIPNGTLPPSQPPTLAPNGTLPPTTRPPNVTSQPNGTFPPSTPNSTLPPNVTSQPNGTIPNGTFPNTTFPPSPPPTLAPNGTLSPTTQPPNVTSQPNGTFPPSTPNSTLPPNVTSQPNGTIPNGTLPPSQPPTLAPNGTLPPTTRPPNVTSQPNGTFPPSTPNSTLPPNVTSQPNGTIPNGTFPSTPFPPSQPPTLAPNGTLSPTTRPPTSQPNGTFPNTTFPPSQQPTLPPNVTSQPNGTFPNTTFPPSQQSTLPPTFAPNGTLPPSTRPPNVTSQPNGTFPPSQPPTLTPNITLPPTTRPPNGTTTPSQQPTLPLTTRPPNVTSQPTTIPNGTTGAVCTVQANCSNRALFAKYDRTRNLCMCTCRNYWNGSSCSICPNPYMGTDCNDCPSNTILPNCRTCSSNVDCNNRASVTTPNRDRTGCLCTCRNQWAGARCEKCDRTLYDGDDCDRCAANRENYPSCTVKNTQVDVNAIKANCTSKCKTAGCSSSSVVLVQSQYLCSCGDCTVVNTRMCATLTDGSKKPCYSPAYRCLSMASKDMCVAQVTGPVGGTINKYFPCGPC